jgi:Fe2+ or Zn2+ uptake regulation protein
LLGGSSVRYSKISRVIVTCLSMQDRPLSAAELHQLERSVPLSSLYRNLTVLTGAGVLRRIPGSDGVAHYELTEAASGDCHRHEYLLCADCGLVGVVALPDGLESVVTRRAEAARRELGFVVKWYRVELIGRCAQCTRAGAVDDAKRSD